LLHIDIIKQKSKNKKNYANEQMFINNNSIDFCIALHCLRENIFSKIYKNIPFKTKIKQSRLFSVLIQ